MRLKIIVFLVAAFCLFAVPSFAADVTGTWEGEMAMPKMEGGPGGGGGGMGPQGPMKFIYTLKQDGKKLSGSVKGPRNTNEITDGKIEGDKITISYKIQGMQGSDMSIKWDGVVEGDQITFTMVFEGMGGGAGGGGGMQMPPMKVVAKKQK